MNRHGIAERARRIGLSFGALAGASGIHPCALSTYLRGHVNPPAGVEARVLEVLRQCERLAAAFPVAVNMRNAEQLRGWLEDLRIGRFSRYEAITESKQALA